MTVAEWVVLRELLEIGKAMPSELAEKIGMTRGAISKLVERLATKSLVVRSASREDGRAQYVALTTKGKRLVPILAKLADENDDQFFGQLATCQREALLAILQSIVASNGWKTVPLA